MRFEDSNGLFGSESASATSEGIYCQWCNTTTPADHSGTSTCFTHFGDLQVADCCYEKVEAAVLGRMDDILPWLIRIIQLRKRRTEAMETLIREIRQALNSA